jgi:4-amino-4-deoxy-L-arabinose transferase-like glycosyltransferase
MTLSLPWAAFVPGAFAVALMRRFSAHRRQLAYLLLWCVGLFVLFTASAAKREHYILPVLPALCLLMGFVAEDVFFKHVWIASRLARFLGVAYGAAGIAGVASAAAGWYVSVGQTEWGAWFAASVAAAVPAVAAGWLALKGRFKPVVGLIAAAVTAIYLVHWGTVHLYDERRPIYDFALEVAKTVPADQELCHWGDPQAKVVFYAGRTIPAVQWPFRRMDPNFTDEQADCLALQWLMDNPSHVPWLAGYCPAGSPLELAGYRPALWRQDIQEKRLRFTLYRRGEASEPTTGDAPLR